MTAVRFDETISHGGVTHYIYINLFSVGELHKEYKAYLQRKTASVPSEKLQDKTHLQLNRLLFIGQETNIIHFTSVEIKEELELNLR